MGKMLFSLVGIILGLASLVAWHYNRRSADEDELGKAVALRWLVGAIMFIALGVTSFVMGLMEVLD